ncbi:uncharacterized protein VNE69_01333 [Vairimorpha necatrix]|uniref:Uncharacterized protein n=1 Tax=Vairimorpha necatrix TaxID=6039 RepID=A0AAX4J8Z7_9MICR
MDVRQIMEICLNALASGSFSINDGSEKFDPSENQSTREGASASTSIQKEKLNYTVDITYSHKYNNQKKMIFSKLVDDCFLKDSAKDEYLYSDRDGARGFEYNIKLTKVKDKKLPGNECEGLAEKGNEFAFLDEEIEYTIKKDNLNETMLNGKSVFVDIANSPKFNYLVLPLYLSPYTIYYNSGSVIFKQETNVIFGLFGDLLVENFLNLNQKDNNIVMKFIKEFCAMSQSTFNSKYNDKTFLLANQNLPIYKKVFETLKNFKAEKKMIPSIFVERVLETLNFSMADLKLSKYYTDNAYTRERLRRFDPSRKDSFTNAVGLGIITDILNLLKLCRNPEHKFNFYEAMSIIDMQVKMKAFVKVNIEFEEAEQVEDKDVEIMCNCKTLLPGFNFNKSVDEIQLSFMIEDVQKCRCFIEKILISILKNDKLYETDWIKVDTEEKLPRDFKD